ncbi:peptide-methionine (S)-S-oxide reductase MsrA [Burkholderiaceae bacterium DAT-1]|nr:peptide-methionine (S)-S-oxide reductase MsrA [Burkholderiaceae bacterium DAT-1]
MPHLNSPSHDVITLGGGCFWCLEAVFSHLRGVESCVSGYMGGTVDGPDYEAVCAGTTGHAEVVQLKFNPTLVDLRTLLDIFFTIHDPTTLNRQGNDVGTQYRSAIFWHHDAQHNIIQHYLSELIERRDFADPIVTEITPAVTFWPAERYHQHYFAQHPEQPYCQYVVASKVRKAVQHFPDLFS